MKRLLLLSAVICLAFFSACQKAEVHSDFGPADEELMIAQTNDRGVNQDESNDIKAIFTIGNKDHELWENDELLLTNNSVNAVSFHWDFGNGDSSTDAHPTYKYKMHGYYTVTLTTTSANGNTDAVDQEILVLCVFGGNHDR